MKNKILFYISFLMFCSALASTKNEENFFYRASLNKGQVKSILKGKILSETDLTDLNKTQQKFQFTVQARHPRSCQKALRKLSQYQDYKKFLGFVKKSDYDDKTNILFLSLEPPVIKRNFYLFLKLPRIQSPGIYDFTFEKGFLRELKGQITVKKTPNNKCFLQMNGHWQGQKLKYSKILFELFSQTVLKIGLERLVRMSSI